MDFDDLDDDEMVSCDEKILHQRVVMNKYVVKETNIQSSKHMYSKIQQ